jgi:hypothetical protein
MEIKGKKGKCLLCKDLATIFFTFLYLSARATSDLEFVRAIASVASRASRLRDGLLKELLLPNGLDCFPCNLTL